MATSKKKVCLNKKVPAFRAEVTGDQLVKLSDYKGKKLVLTPWNDREAAMAYLCYFFPLNYVRNLKAIDETQKTGFFNGLSHFVDFGCGLGTSSLALLDLDLAPQNILAVDHSAKALEMMEFFIKKTQPNSLKVRYQNKIHQLEANSLVMSSYSINELKKTPDFYQQAEALLFLEPSTRDISRQLIQSRSELILAGHKAWAPCLHQSQCPLSSSKKDWCHDRLHWIRPAWIEEIESQLPMKNNSLSFSYLACRQQEPPQYKASAWRITGDERIEKGKVKWLACQNNERLFLSWLNRHGKPPQWKRGDLIDAQTSELKANEWRLKPECNQG